MTHNESSGSMSDWLLCMEQPHAFLCAMLCMQEFALYIIAVSWHYYNPLSLRKTVKIVSFYVSVVLML